MKNLTVLIFLVNIATLLHGQEVVYTINCEKNGQNTNLDSILFENLSSDTHLFFKELSIQNSYVVNLSQQKIEGSTGVTNIIDDGQVFKIVKNIPGEISIQCTNKQIGDIDLTMYNLSGQRLFIQKICSNCVSSTFSVYMPNTEMYVLNIHSIFGDFNFKAMGSDNIGSIGYSSIQNSVITFKSATVKQASDFRFQQGDSLRITAYQAGKSTLPISLKVNGADTLSLFFIEENENYFIIDNEKYPLNLGYDVWFSELDCGNYDIFAHGLYLTSNVTIKKIVDSQGMSLLPSGKGNMLMFNLFNKNSELIPGKYVFVDDINCSGVITDGSNTFTMGSTDKFVSAVKEMNDPTSYALNVDLDIDWSTVDFNNPSSDMINRVTKYLNSRIGIKEGNVTIVKSGDIYTITFDCTDNNGTKITGKYKGNLSFVEFGI
jgi:hypothetical protein